MMFEWKLLMAAKKPPFSQKATTYTGNIKVHTIRGVKDCILYVNSYLCVCVYNVPQFGVLRLPSNPV